MPTIREIGDPILRQTATEIVNIADHTQLYHDLISTLKLSSGVGLAAPQIGESLRVFLMRSRPGATRPNSPDHGPRIVINPYIIDQSDNIEEDREGCLSIPGPTASTGLKGRVPRPDRIHASRHDPTGKPYNERLSGFEARIFLHEYDHLEGIFFVDKMDSLDSLSTHSEYQKIL